MSHVSVLAVANRDSCREQGYLRGRRGSVRLERYEIKTKSEMREISGHRDVYCVQCIFY